MRLLRLAVQVAPQGLDRRLQPEPGLGVLQLGPLQLARGSRSSSRSAADRSRRRPSSAAATARVASDWRCRRLRSAVSSASTTVKPVARRAPQSRSVATWRRIDLDPAGLGVASLDHIAAEPFVDLGQPPRRNCRRSSSPAPRTSRSLRSSRTACRLAPPDRFRASASARPRSACSFSSDSSAGRVASSSVTRARSRVGLARPTRPRARRATRASVDASRWSASSRCKRLAWRAAIRRVVLLELPGEIGLGPAGCCVQPVRRSLTSASRDASAAPLPAPPGWRASSRAAPVAPDPPVRRCRHPVGPNRSPASVTTTASGMGQRDVDGFLPAIDCHRAPTSASSSGSTRRARPRTWVRSGSAGGRGRGTAAVDQVDREHRSRLASPSAAPASARRRGGDVVDQDRGQRLGGRRLERRLPAGIDLDRLDQRADRPRRRRPDARLRQTPGPRREPRRAPRRRAAHAWRSVSAAAERFLRRAQRRLARRPGRWRPRRAARAADLRPLRRRRARPAAARSRRRAASTLSDRASRRAAARPFGLRRGHRSTATPQRDSSPRTSAARPLGTVDAVRPVPAANASRSAASAASAAASWSAAGTQRLDVALRPRPARRSGGPPRPRGWR